MISFIVFVAILGTACSHELWDGVVHEQDWQTAQDADLSVYANQDTLKVYSTWKPKSCETARKVETGDTVTVKYVVKLTDNTGFANSATYEFVIGSGDVVEGWELGLVGACIGENRRLVVPPTLGYGENAYEPDKDDPEAQQLHIPAHAVVIFDTQILSITDTK